LGKKEFTSFDIAIIVHELNETIADSRVNNIYQLNEKTFVLKLHKTDTPSLRLVIESGKRLHLTAYALKPPKVPPAFCMALRKHLRGAWVDKIEQYEFERVVTIYLRNKMGVLRLIVELFGEGNIILTGKKGEILQALTFRRMRDRNIIRGEVYHFPPSSGKNPFSVSKEELEKALKASGDVEVVRAIARFLGVGGFYAEETLLRANIEKTKQSSALNSKEVDGIFRGLQSLLSAVNGFKVEPHIVLAEDGSFQDALPFKLKRYVTLRSQPYKSFNEAVDELYLRATAAEKAVASVEVDKLKQEAERLKRVITEQEKALLEDEAKAKRNRCIGDIIYAHSSEVQTLLNRFTETKRARKDWNNLISEVIIAKDSDTSLNAFIESFDRQNLLVNVRMDNLRFSLNLRRTLFENAAKYYDRGKKAKQKSAGALRALEESRRKLHEIEKRLREAEALKTKPVEVMKELAKRKVKPKEWYEKFRWFTSSDGLLVVAGKDAVSNEVLIKKHAAAENPVFHADIVGAPFVVVKTEGKVPSEQVLCEAGEFAAAFSRGWREGISSADVYWVKPEQLSKGGTSGEYVPRGGFAVIGKRNWMRSVPLQLAVGVVGGEKVRFVGGPLEAVKAKTKAYVTLVPGDVSGKKFLNQILQALTLKMPKAQREKIEKSSIEQIREFVPYTKGRLAKHVS
jgi:predicted ribosome quality control (RQC) complex YloA/Tae2 family protein